MTALLTELGGAARALARQGVVVTVVLSLAVGITCSLALDALDALDALERRPNRA